MKRKINMKRTYPRGYKDKIDYHKSQENWAKVAYFEKKQAELEGSKEDPKMVRYMFEEGEYDYAKGGGIEYKDELNEIANLIKDHEESIKLLERNKKLLMRTPQEVERDLEARYGKVSYARGGEIDNLPYRARHRVIVANALLKRGFDIVEDTMDKEGYGTIHLEHNNGGEAYISEWVQVWIPNPENESLWHEFTDSTAVKEGVNAWYNQFTKTLRDNGFKVQKNRPQYNLNKFYEKGGSTSYAGGGEVKALKQELKKLENTNSKEAYEKSNEIRDRIAFLEAKELHEKDSTYQGGGEVYFPTIEYERNGEVFREVIEVKSPSKKDVYKLAKKKINEKYNNKIKHIGLGSYGENVDSISPLRVKNKKGKFVAYQGGGEIEGYDIDEVVKHFAIAGLWASTDWDTDEPLDENYNLDDISEESYTKIKNGAVKFIKENKSILKKHNISAESLGHDLFLDSQGHGVGFWDRGYGEDGDVLSASASKTFVSDQPYVGDDGKIYFKQGGSVSGYFSGELTFLNW